MKKTWRRMLNWITNNKKKFTLICGSVFTVGILVVVLAIAFFTDSDEVTNKLKGSDVDIKLYEPSWNEEGMDKAAYAEPGMIIEKDPYVYNNSDESVYVRFCVQIKYAINKSTSLTTLNPTTATYRKYYAGIVSNIYWKSKTGDAKMLLTDANGKSLRDAYAASSKFNLKTGVQSTNPNFIYKGDGTYGYFYYANDEDCISVASGEQTEKLFDYIKIPELKDEYNKTFDTKFQIVVTAQAIPVAYPDSSSLDDVRAAFKTKFGN